MFSEKIFYRAADSCSSEMLGRGPIQILYILSKCKLILSAFFTNVMFLNVRIHQIYCKLDLIYILVVCNSLQPSLANGSGSENFEYTCVFRAQ